MDRIPVAGLQTEGRTLGTDWSIANVARLLRSNAGSGAWDSASATSGSRAAANQYYLRKGSVRHIPTQTSLVFMRLARENCWYASLCFSGDDGYLPWDAEAAELWLWALFGEDRPRVVLESGDRTSVRQFTLSATTSAGNLPNA